MASHNIKDFRFTPLTEESLSSFTPPTTAEVYDHMFERAAVINKYNFSQEVIHSKDGKKYELIKKLENEIPETSKRLQELSSVIKSSKQEVFDLNAINKIKEIDQKIEKLQVLNKQFNKNVNTSPLEPILIPSLDEKSKEHIINDLGVDINVNIPIYMLDELKNDYHQSKISKSDYEKKYNSLALKYSNVKPTDKLFNFYSNIFLDIMFPILNSHKYKDDFDLKNDRLLMVETILWADYKYSNRNFFDKVNNYMISTEYKKEFIENISETKMSNVKYSDYKQNELIFSEYSSEKKFNAIIRMAHAMMWTDNRFVILNKEDTIKYKNMYENTGDNRFFYKEYNNKIYVSGSDLNKLAESDINWKDTTNNNSKLSNFELLSQIMELGLIALNNPLNNERYRKGIAEVEISKWDENLKPVIPSHNMYLKELMKFIAQKDRSDKPDNIKLNNLLDIRGGGDYMRFAPKNLFIHDYKKLIMDSPLSISLNEKEKEINKNFRDKARGYLYNTGKEILKNYPDNVYEIGIDEKWIRSVCNGIINLSAVYDDSIESGFMYTHLSNDRRIYEDFRDQGLTRENLEIIMKKYIPEISTNILDKMTDVWLRDHKKHYIKPGHYSEIQVKTSEAIINKLFETFYHKLNWSVRPNNLQSIALNKYKEEIKRISELFEIDSILDAKAPDVNSFKYANMPNFEDKINDVKTLKRLGLGLNYQKNVNSPYMSDMIDSSKLKNSLILKHNEVLGKYKSSMEIRETTNKRFGEIVNKIKELKIDNYVVTNKVDNAKFAKMMKTLVDMIKVGENKNTIIDLTDIDNFDSILETLDSTLGGLDEMTKNAMILNYIVDMNKLYKSRGHIEEYEEMRLDYGQQMLLSKFDKALLLREDDLDNMVEQLDKVEKDERYGNNKTGIKVYEGKHFPLFIDKETLSIWSIEWTSKHPTLSISTIAPEILDNYKKNNKPLEKWFEKNIIINTPEKLKSEEYKDVFIAGYMDWIEQSFNNMDRYNGKCQVHVESLDRIREIFSLIQTNYFVQLGQNAATSMFIDIDPNYLEKYEHLVGAVPFMSNTDQSLIYKFDKYMEQLTDYKQNMMFIDPLNYESKYISTMVESNFRKMYGLNKEDVSKKEMMTILSRVKQLGRSDFYTNDELLIKNSLRYIYGENSISTDELPENIKKLIDSEIKNLRLFTDIKDLEKYRREFLETMSKDFEFKTIE